jgi:hypothetical protein
MSRLPLPVLAATLLLAGCQALTWDKPGMAPELIQQDQQECGRLASQQAFRDYAFRSNPFPSPFFDRRADARWFAYSRQLELDRMGHEAQLQDFCMRARGYELVPLR